VRWDLKRAPMGEKETVRAWLGKRGQMVQATLSAAILPLLMEWASPSPWSPWRLQHHDAPTRRSLTPDAPPW